MARTLALLALTTSETAPGPTAAVPATVFTTAHMNNQLFRSLTGGNSVHSRPRLLQGLLGRQSLREYLNTLASIRPKATGSTRVKSPGAI
jgi:hypothetical protein